MHHVVQLKITFTFPSSAITLSFCQTLHLQNRVFDPPPPEKWTKHRLWVLKIKDLGDVHNLHSYHIIGWITNHDRQNPLFVQIPNVGIPSTIQWRFYNAKRFAVIPEWQMEKKLQFISDRITGWLSKQSIKNKWKLFTGYFVVTVIWKSNILWKFCFSILFICRPLGIK